jgi:hypothetical protein
MTYKTVMDWMIGFIASYTFTQFGSTRHYSAIAILRNFQFTAAHALGFSVSSGIVAMDLSQSHCNFKSHVKSYYHSLIPFLSFLLNHLRLPSPKLDPILIRLLFCYSASTSTVVYPVPSSDCALLSQKKTHIPGDRSKGRLILKWQD